MDILTLVTTIFRQWFITVPIFLAAVGGALYLQSTVPPQYEATGSVLLEQPEFDPSRLPIFLLNMESIAAETEAAIASGLASGEEVLVRVRDREAVEAVVVAEDLDRADELARSALAETEDRMRAIQEEADVPISEQVLLSSGGTISSDQLVDGEIQVSAVGTILDPAAHTPNPYAADSTTAELLRVAVMSDEGRLRLADELGAGVGYEVSLSNQEGAILQITTAGSDPDAVLAAFEPVREELQQEFQRRQERAEVPDSRQITVQPLAAPQSVADVSPPVDRSAAAIVALGGFAAVAAAVIAESVRSRRGQRRRQKSPETSWTGSVISEGPPDDLDVRPAERAASEHR